MKTGIIAAIIAITAITAGCVRYYKTTVINNSLIKIESKTVALIKTAEDDYSQRELIYDSLMQNVRDRSITPYPLIKGDLDEMSKQIKNMNSRLSRITAVKTEIAEISKNRSRIKSNDPEWKILESRKNEIEKLNKALTGDLNKYRQSADIYSKRIRDYSILKINTAELKKRISDYDKKITENIAETKKRIAETRMKLTAAVAKGYSDEKAQKKRAVLVKIAEILINIEKENNEIKKLVKNFEAEAGSKTELWAGPGMTAHDILTQIKMRADRINSYTADFDRLNRELNR